MLIEPKSIQSDTPHQYWFTDDNHQVGMPQGRVEHSQVLRNDVLRRFVHRPSKVWLYPVTGEDISVHRDYYKHNDAIARGFMVTKLRRSTVKVTPMCEGSVVAHIEGECSSRI